MATADDADLVQDIQRLVEGKMREDITTLHKRGSFVVTVDIELFMSLHKLLDPACKHKNDRDFTHEVITRSLKSLANIIDTETGRVLKRKLSHAPSNSGIRLTSANTLPSNVALLSQPSYNNSPPRMLRPTLERISADGMRRRLVASTPSSFAPVGADDARTTLADVFRDIAEMGLPDIKAGLSNIVGCTRSSLPVPSDNNTSSRGVGNAVSVSRLITDYIIEYGTTVLPAPRSREIVCRFCGLAYHEENVDMGAFCCEKAAKLRKIADEWHLQRKEPYCQGFVMWDADTMANILDDFQSHITDEMIAPDPSVNLREEGMASAPEQNGHVITKKRRKPKQMDNKPKPYDSREDKDSFKEVAAIPSGESEQELRVTNFCHSDVDNKDGGRRPTLVSGNPGVAAAFRALVEHALSDGFLLHVTKSEMTSRVVTVEDAGGASASSCELSLGRRPPASDTSRRAVSSRLSLVDSEQPVSSRLVPADSEQLVSSRLVPADSKQLVASRLVPADSEQLVSSRLVPADSKQLVASRLVPADSKLLVASRLVPADSKQPVASRLVPADSKQLVSSRLVPADSKQLVSSRLVPADSKQLVASRLVAADSKQLVSSRLVPADSEQLVASRLVAADSKQLVSSRLVPADSKQLVSSRLVPADSKQLVASRLVPADSKQLVASRLVPADSKQLVASRLVPADSKQLVASRLVPADSKQLVASRLVPADSKQLVASRLVPADSKQMVSSRLVPADSKQMVSSRLAPADSKQLVSSRLVPADSKQMVSSRLAPADSKQLVSSRLVPADSMQLLSSRLVPADSMQLLSSRLVPADSKQLASSRLVPTDSKQLVSSRLVPTDSKQLLSSRLVPADSKQLASSRLVPSDSKQLVSSRLVPADSNQLVASRLVPADSKQLVSSRLAPANSKQLVSSRLVPADSNQLVASRLVPADSKQLVSSRLAPANSKQLVSSRLAPADSKQHVSPEPVHADSKQQISSTLDRPVPTELKQQAPSTLPKPALDTKEDASSPLRRTLPDTKRRAFRCSPVNAPREPLLEAFKESRVEGATPSKSAATEAGASGTVTVVTPGVSEKKAERTRNKAVEGGTAKRRRRTAPGGERGADDGGVVVRLVKSHEGADGGSRDADLSAEEDRTVADDTTVGVVGGARRPPTPIDIATADGDEEGDEEGSGPTPPGGNESPPTQPFMALPQISESEESLQPNPKSPKQKKRRTPDSAAESDTSEGQRTRKTSKKSSTLHVMISGTRRSKRSLRSKSKQRRLKPLDEQRQLDAARRHLEEVLRGEHVTDTAAVNSMIFQLRSSPLEEAATVAIASDCDSDASSEEPSAADSDVPDASRARPSVEAGASPSVSPARRERGRVEAHLPVPIAEIVKLLNAVARFVQSKRTRKNYDSWLELRELLLAPSVRHRLTDEMWIKLSNMLFPELRGTTKHITYQAIPAHPHFCWFRARDKDQVRYYPQGSCFSVFHKNGSGKIFYPDGVLAIEFITKERGSRYMVYSPATRHVVPSLCAESVLVAMFDLNGNGVIYDTDGSVRLHYTQREGVMLDSVHGMPVVWSWPVGHVPADPFEVLVDELFHLSRDPDRAAPPDESVADLPDFPDIDDSKKDLLARTSRGATSSVVRRADVSAIPTVESPRPDGRRPTTDEREPAARNLRATRKESGRRVGEVVTPRDGRTNRRTPRAESRGGSLSDDEVDGPRASNEEEEDDDVYDGNRSKVDFVASVRRGGRRPCAEVASRVRSPEVGSDLDQNTWREIWLPVTPDDEVYDSDRDRVAKWKCRHLRPDLCAHYPQIPLKINEYMSFRLSGQADVALTFSAEKVSLRIELGVVVNPTVKIRVDLYDSESWPETRIPQCTLERFPPTVSMAEVGESLGERRRRKRERDAKKEALERKLGLGNWQS